MGGGCIGTIAGAIAAGIWAAGNSPNHLFILDPGYWGPIAAIIIGGGVLGLVWGALAGSRIVEDVEPKETSVSNDEESQAE